MANDAARITSTRTAHVYEVRPRSDKRGFDLISVDCGVASQIAPELPMAAGCVNVTPMSSTILSSAE